MEVEPWDEYDLSNWNSLVRKAKSKGQLNEGRAIITFKNDYEVEMNTGEGYDDDFEYFEAGEREQVYILDKNDKRVHVEFGDGTNAYIPTGLISIQDKSLNEDRKYNQEELLRLDLIARRRFDCDYEKCTDEQKAEVLKDKDKVGVKEQIKETVKFIMDDLEGYSNYFPGGKTKGLSSDEMSTILMQIVKDIEEEGKQINEKLCKKGEAYRKRRMAAPCTLR